MNLKKIVKKTLSILPAGIREKVFYIPKRIRAIILSATKRTPKISIVMPCYNCEKYLAETIKSIQQQSFREFEIIIVDDCSTDKTRKIIRRACKTDYRIRAIFFEQNQGVSVARQTGIDSAKAEYINCMDCDDVWLSQDALLELYNEAKTSGSDVVVAGYRRVENGEIAETAPWIVKLFSNDDSSSIFRKAPKTKTGKSKYLDVVRGTIADFPEIMQNTTPWGKLYRRDFLVDEGIKYDPNMRVYEDYCTVGTAYLKAKKISVLAKNFYGWVIREDRTSLTNKYQKTDYGDFTRRAAAYKKVLETIDSLGFSKVKRTTPRSEGFQPTVYESRLNNFLKNDFVEPVELIAVNNLDYYKLVKDEIMFFYKKAKAAHLKFIRPELRVIYEIMNLDSVDDKTQFAAIKQFSKDTENLMIKNFFIKKIKNKACLDLEKTSPSTTSFLKKNKKESLLDNLFLIEDQLIPVTVVDNCYTLDGRSYIDGWVFLSKIAPKLFEYKNNISLYVGGKKVNCKTQFGANEFISQVDKDETMDMRNTAYYVSCDKRIVGKAQLVVEIAAGEHTREKVIDLEFRDLDSVPKDADIVITNFEISKSKDVSFVLSGNKISNNEGKDAVKINLKNTELNTTKEVEIKKSSKGVTCKFSLDDFAKKPRKKISKGLAAGVYEFSILDENNEAMQFFYKDKQAKNFFYNNFKARVSFVNSLLFIESFVLK